MIQNNYKSLAKAYPWDSFREPSTPERDRQSEREQQRLQQLQMTSPSIRRQRQSERQQPIPQPNFGEPSNVGQIQPTTAAGSFAPVQGRIDYQQRLQQGYHS